MLAPEVVTWNIGFTNGEKEKVAILQQRACFTELGATELAKHSAVFGPISLSFDIGKLRGIGATPVIYSPQGVADNPLSQIGALCVRGAYHTKYVLEQLQGLREASDPELAIKKFGHPLAPNCKITLKNTDPSGTVVAQSDVLASDINNIMQHVGYRNIPFDHSVGILSVFLNMFYPTDNTFSGDELGYYRQREWRLIGGPAINGRAMGRKLNAAEHSRLVDIDQKFWCREIEIPKADVSQLGDFYPRSSLALVYDPVDDFDFLAVVDSVLVPKEAEIEARAIVGDKVVVTA